MYESKYLKKIEKRINEESEIKLKPMLEAQENKLIESKQLWSTAITVPTTMMYWPHDPYKVRKAE